MNLKSPLCWRFCYKKVNSKQNKNRTKKNILSVKVYACTKSFIQKVLRTLKTKYLQNFNNLRKVAGKLISTNFPKKTKIYSFCYLTLVWVWDRLTNAKSWYYSSNSNSPVWSQTYPVPQAAVCAGQSGQTLRLPGHLTLLWH